MSSRQHPLITPLQLGQLLQSTRKAKGLSQATLASRLAISQSRVSHLEQHPQDISVAQLMTWCAILELELTLGSKNTYAVRENRGTEW